MSINSGTYFPKDELPSICKKFSSKTKAITGITKLIPIASSNDRIRNTPTSINIE